MPQTIDNMSAIWSNSLTTYTFLKTNITGPGGGAEQSAAGSLLMDLQVGGSSKFSVRKDGAFCVRNSAGNGVFVTYTSGNRWSFNDIIGLNAGNGVVEARAFHLGNSVLGGEDLILGRRAAANLRLGAADAAAPVAQTLSVQSVAAGTTNTAGANLTITGSQGTGTGAGGSIVFQVAPAGSSGTAQNALVDALTIRNDRVVTLTQSNSDTTITSLTGASLVLDNAGSQTKLAFLFSGIIRGGIRADSSGNFNWHATGSQGHQFYNSSGDNQSFTGTGLAINCQAGGGTTISGISLFGSIGWRGGTSTSNANDVILTRDAANTLALRNGAAAQTFRVYSAYTDDINYSRLSMFEVSGDSAWYFKPQNLGSGAARSIVIGASDAGGTSVYFQTAGSTRWRVDSTGHFLANADNQYDIGASNATRPRAIYAAGSIVAGANLFAGSSGQMTISNRMRLSSPTNGNLLLLNDASDNFGLLMLGGTTSSFPALKRSSTTLQARLADDSAFASVQGKLTTDTAYQAGAPTATGYLVLYDSTGTAYRVPAVLN